MFFRYLDVFGEIDTDRQLFYLMYTSLLSLEILVFKWTERNKKRTKTKTERKNEKKKKQKTNLHG